MPRVEPTPTAELRSGRRSSSSESLRLGAARSYGSATSLRPVSLGGGRGSSSSVLAAGSFHGAPAGGASEVVFERPMPTLSFLVISSWLVPTVTKRFRGLGSWLISCAVRGVLIAHIAVATRTKLSEDELGQCSTPAVLQWAAIYVFGTQCIAEFSALAALDMAWTSTRVRVAGGYGVGRDGVVRQEEAKVVGVRRTSAAQRALLCAVALSEMAIEGTLLVIGVIYLMWARTLVDLIADTVALHFVALVDDLMFQAYFTAPTKERLSKYEFERRWAVRGGSTSLKGAGRGAQLLSRGQGVLSILWLGVSGLVVLAGMLDGLVNGSREMSQACAFFVTPDHVRYD